MDRIIGPQNENLQLNERITPMHLARKKTDCIRARDFISRGLDTSRHSILSTKSFKISDDVCFNRQKHSWQTGTVTIIDQPTVMVIFVAKLYPAHEARVRAHFGGISIPSPLAADQRLPNRPESGPSWITVRPAPLLELLNTGYGSSNVLETTCLTLEISDTRNAFLYQSAENLTLTPTQYYSQLKRESRTTVLF